MIDQPKVYEQETSQVRKGHEFSVENLQSYLAANVPNVRDPLQISQFKVGQSNPTFLVQSGETKLVIRKKPPGKLVATAHAVEREFRILKALHPTDVPVPRVFALCEDAAVIGTPFYVMEFVKGRIFIDAKLSTVPIEERATCYHAGIKTLARLHRINPAQIGLGDYGKPQGFYRRQIDRMAATSRAQEIKDAVPSLPYLEQLAAWFSKNLPDDEATIVHGDYKLDNLIFHPTEPRVIGVLDWELSSLGHPLSDLANFCLHYYFPQDFLFGGLLGVDLAEARLPSVQDLLKTYCQEINRPYPLKSWTFCVAFAFFRLSVILQGVAFRSERGQASSMQAKQVGKLAGAVNGYAWKVITDAAEAPSKL